MPFKRNYRRKRRPKNRQLSRILSALFIVFLLAIIFNSVLKHFWQKGIPAPVPSGPKTGAPRKPMLTVIVDDCGYSLTDCNYISDFNTPVTISVLPHLDNSKPVAACAKKADKEVMLHLPLQPHQLKEKYDANYIITTEMNGREVIEKFNSALSSVPYASGINNHMGSKATENRRLMSIIFAQIDKRGLFFVDSRVTAKTICPGLAKEKGIPFLQRDIFLDNENDRDYIETQFNKLKSRAREQGYAIGICHARPLSWTILKEQTDTLRDEGFEIVTVNTLLASFK